jgi:hypothetical protein
MKRMPAYSARLRRALRVLNATAKNSSDVIRMLLPVITAVAIAVRDFRRAIR